MTHRWLAGLVLLTACSAGRTAPVTPAAANSPRETVSAFMQAAADSNLAKMAALWGTASGSAAATHQPPNWEERVQIMQVYLQNSSHKVLSETHGDQPNQRLLQVRFQRGACDITVPVTVVETDAHHWLVNNIDLNQAGTPGRACKDQDQP